jgi:hypothetical protein
MNEFQVLMKNVWYICATEVLLSTIAHLPRSKIHSTTHQKSSIFNQKFIPCKLMKNTRQKSSILCQKFIPCKLRKNTHQKSSILCQKFIPCKLRKNTHQKSSILCQKFIPCKVNAMKKNTKSFEPTLNSLIT